MFEKEISYESSMTTEDINSCLRTDDFDALRIFSILKSSYVYDIGFLSQLSGLCELDVTSALSYNVDIFYDIRDIKTISLSYPGCHKIEFGRMKTLTDVYLDCGRKKPNFKNASHITFLSISELIGNDIMFLQDCKKLKTLRITSSPLKTVDFVENNIEELFIGGCRSLTNINGLHNFRSLKRLTINGCRRIEEFSVIASCSNLEEIELIDCGPIPSASFLKGLKKLTSVKTAGSVKFVDGKVSFLKSIDNVSLSEYDHYDASYITEEDMANHQANMDMLKKLFG